MCKALSCLSAVALAGCAAGATTPVAGIGQSASFTCVAADHAADPGASPYSLIVLGRSQDGQGLVLDRGFGQPEVLSPIGGSPGTLFANASFAWRVGSPVSVLTDVENVQTFNCNNVGATQAVHYSLRPGHVSHSKEHVSHSNQSHHSR